MKKQLLYLMFAAAIVCSACSDDDNEIKSDRGSGKSSYRDFR